jgi:protein-disulfide isomerase
MPLHHTLLIALLSQLLAAQGGSCPALTPANRSRLESYVIKKYRVPQTIQLQLADQAVISDGCYRRLVFSGRGPLGKVELKLFASPDLRFLSTDLMDSSSDPDREEEEQAKTLMGQLVEGDYAFRGSNRAPVKLVVFSDFQCPFCRKMKDLIASEPLLADGHDVQLVFRHMPLAQHDWAEQAARAAACAQFQSQDAFWAMHDALFDSQGSITAESLLARIYEMAARVPSLKMDTLKTCMEKQMSLGIVMRDRQLGLKVGVSATPTLFLNGQRLGVISTAKDLHDALAQAISQANAAESAAEGRRGDSNGLR